MNKENMKRKIRINIALLLSGLMLAVSCTVNDTKTNITGDLMHWHKVTLTIDGPMVNESDTSPNPFLDYRMMVTFKHESGSPSYKVPGYFAADGNAAETSADFGNKWRAHLSPDKEGQWNYEVTIIRSKNVAIDDNMSQSASTVIHSKGSFRVYPTDKTGRDFRSKGRLQYVGKRYLQFAGSKEYFLKAGADSPENLLAYNDFDGTYSNKVAGLVRADEANTAPLKTWQPHVKDWQTDDPTWKEEKGKGLIGALNYLAGKGCNSVSFLTYNVGGDGDDVWPYIAPDDKLHFDCSKLDQWQIVFDHAQTLGLYLHFKLQETENDDTTHPDSRPVTAALDDGDLGIERKLYLRELVARFGYELALNWNLGEENTQTTIQQQEMAKYLHNIDPYQHHRVIHTYPDWQDRVYEPLLGDQSMLTGISLQNGWSTVHQRVIHWIQESEKAGKTWVVANDEQNPHYTGVPPDTGYEGFDGVARPEQYSEPYTIHDIRKYTLWGALMAGGAGVEYYFGYTLPQTDLDCENWRSRDQSWGYCGIALDFFHDNKIPFWEMDCNDSLVGNMKHDNSKYCFTRPGNIYVIYLPNGGSTYLDLSDDTSSYTIHWFNPRTAGSMQSRMLSEVKGPGKISIGLPPKDAAKDWVVLLQKKE